MNIMTNRLNIPNALIMANAAQIMKMIDAIQMNNFSLSILAL
jgi:hypothetical protein